MSFTARLNLLMLCLAAAAATAGGRIAEGDGGSGGHEVVWRASGADSARRVLPLAGTAAVPPETRAPGRALAKGVFLIAAEELEDPNFAQTVVLLLEYDQTGAIGLIINRPSEVSLAAALPQVDALKGRPEKLFLGGPVGRRHLFLLVRSPSPPDGTRPVLEGVYASSSLETLRRVIAEQSEHSAFQAYAGYSGWGPGQLESELERGDWLVTPGDAEIVFDRPPATIWLELIRRNSGQWVFREGSGDLTHRAAAPF